MPSNVLPLHLKQTFLPIIWIFTEGEGDEIESTLPFKIFSTLITKFLLDKNEIDIWVNTLTQWGQNLTKLHLILNNTFKRSQVKYFGQSKNSKKIAY